MIICRLKEIIDTKGITLDELSKQSGIKISTLQLYYDNKIRKIYFNTLNKLYKALDNDYENLFDNKH